ncbi:MAG: glucoamylase family protein [bacterium]|nr:glucoamylase family protein [bacterium]
MKQRSGFFLFLSFFFFFAPLFLHSLSRDDRKFLEKVAEKTFRYFWDEANAQNGLIPDATKNRNCSISVTGFGLAGICIADSRGWISHQKAYERALVTLRSFIPDNRNPAGTQVQSEHGHPYHWVDLETGQWSGEEGIFPTDTAAFIAGVIMAGEYFKGTEVEKLAETIFRNVDWTWFLNKEKNTVYAGFTPSGGLFGEHSLIEVGTLFLLLGIASPTHPFPVETWFNLGNSYYHAEYGQFSYVGDGAAYTHQWPFCFIDPRWKKDFFLDYFQNAREFSLASRQWCIDNKEQGYGENVWGLNPCVGPDKYGEYACPAIPGASLPYNGKDNDGTIAPTAAISFMPFTPDESLAFTRFIYKKYGSRIFGKYGFMDSFNIVKDFWCSEYLGIDQGPILIMIDNFLNGTVWKYFMQNKFIRDAMDRIGFTGIIDNFDESRHSSPYSKWGVEGDPGAFRFSRETGESREGKNSLKIDFFQPSGKSFLYAEPGLKDYSSYQYLCLWKKGPVDPVLFLEDIKLKREKLKLLSKQKDEEWDYLCYDLSGSRVDKSRIRKILFMFYSGSGPRQGRVYIDHIHLANKVYSGKPSSPQRFFVREGENRGEIKLVWQLKKARDDQGPVATYEIKVSEKPLKSEKDFQQAKDTVRQYQARMTTATQQMVLEGLQPGREYYAAMDLMNSMYFRSDRVTGRARASSRKEIMFQLDKKELVDFNIRDWENFSSSGDTVNMQKVKGYEGTGLELRYEMKKTGNWHWMGIRKKAEGKLPGRVRFSLWVKGKGLDLNIEFKLIDRNGSVFGMKIDDFNFNGEWGEVTIDSSELTYWWGGQGSQQMGGLEWVEIAFSTDEAGTGSVVVNKLTLE